jgi:hypothetical protein
MAAAGSGADAGEGREVTPPRSSHAPEIIWGSVGTAVAVCGVLALALAPELLSLIPGCLWKAATGWPCPTCGATRAAGAMAMGHPMEALAWNPLVGLASLAGLFYLPYAWLVAAGLIAPIRTGWLTAPATPALRWLLLAALILNWIYLVATRV